MSKTAFDSLILQKVRNCSSDYATMIRENGEKVSKKDYWTGLAELAIEQVADENSALDSALNEDPKLFKVLITRISKHLLKTYG